MPQHNDARTLGLVFNYEGELLHQAAIYDQDQLIADLLNAGGSGTVKSTDPEGRTPLHTAASHGSVRCVKALLKRGADPNTISGIEDQCSTPVHHAAKAGHLACLATLLEYEVNLDLKNSEGKKSLDIALEGDRADCKKCADYIKKKMVQRKKEVESAMCEELYDVIDDGLYDKAKEILENISDPYSIINHYYRGPNTLLYRASFGGCIDLVNLLIEFKADGRPNADSGITPLYAACHNGHVEVASRLIEMYPKQLIMPATTEETYPIHAAINNGHIDVVHLLLKHRQPVTTTDDVISERKTSMQDEQLNKPPLKKRSSSTFFYSSIGEGEGGGEVKKAEENYYVDLNIPMKSGYTPLHLAVMHGNNAICQLLLNCQPTVTVSQTLLGVSSGSLVIDSLANDKSPFHHAVLLNKVSTAELFLKHGVDMHQPMIDTSGFSITPLQHACHVGCEEMAKLLLRTGAQDVDNIARIEALQSENENIVQIILNKDVQQSEYDMVLAASEMERGLKSVSISWHKKALEFVKEDWIINAGINLNSSDVTEKLQNDMGLTLKLFTNIDLSNNNLESLPLILFQMPSLKNLNVSKNNVKTIQTATTSNDKDENFDDSGAFGMFTMNWNCPSLETLDISHNCLKEIPKNVFEMPSLQTANFSWNQIASLPFEMWISPSLKTLILEHNNLKGLPMLTGGGSALGGTTKKTKSKTTSPKSSGLDFVDAKKKDFAGTSPFYPKRPSWNDDSDDSDYEEVEVLKKSGISRLDISDNELTAVPPGLPCLAPNLTRLNLSKNKIAEIDTLSSLPEHLIALDVSENSMKHFNVMAGKEGDVVNNMCYALVRKHNHRKSYPQAKRKSCQHRKHNQLLDLTRLNLSKNSLDSVHVCVENEREKPRVLFPDLKILDIANNKLLKVPYGIGRLKNLASFMISNNNVTVLPSQLGLCNNLYELKIDNLHLKDPPKNVIEHATQDGRMDVKSLVGYLKSLHDNAQLYPNIKLMVVGVHGIGKTTLLEALRKEGQGTYKEADHQPHFNDRRINRKLSGNSKGKLQSTVGVDVSDWIYGKKLSIKFSTWDFAGQTEYYATHQCFLSKRALYLVLWKITDGLVGIEKMEQWLLNIQERAPNCSVIIVGTFLDEAERQRKNYVEDMRKEIYKRFISSFQGGGVQSMTEKGLPNIVEVVEVNCKSQRSVAKVRELIYDTVLNLKTTKKSTVSLLETKIPKSYIDVEKAVTMIAEGLNSKNEMPVLNGIKFRAKVFEHLTLCGCELRNGVEELDQAVQFLHDYGILLHYDDPALRDLYFVDPQWLCDMLAHVVTVRSVNPFIKNGVLKITDLKSQIFKGEKRFPTDMVMKYVELMSKFEVAIKISEKFLLIPSLLPDKQKECPTLAENDSVELRKAMNINAYLGMNVLRRQYSMSYVPSGMWARLLTRLIADNRICKIVSQCCDIQGNTDASSEQFKIDSETLMRAAPPEWACWKTGIELSCFGTKLLRVCQLDSNEPYYGGRSSLTDVYVKSRHCSDSSRRVTIEIVAPCLTLTIEKFHQVRPSEDGEGDGQTLVGFRVVGINNTSSQTACKLLVITIEHIDNLLAEWYPKIDTFIDHQGVSAIRRVSFCDQCVQEAIAIKKDSALNTSMTALQDANFSADICGKERVEYSAYDACDDDELGGVDGVDGVQIMFEDDGEIVNDFDGFNSGREAVDFDCFDLSDEEKEWMLEHRELGKGKLIVFELEEASKLLRDDRPLLCPFHLKLDPKNVFPDLCFLDLDKHHIIESDHIKQGRCLGSGSYGDVFLADLTIHKKDVKTVIQVAMKIPLNSEKEKKRKLMATMYSYDTYRNVRQELAILVSINHVNIIRFFGVSTTPFAMLLELAPLGALDDRYKEYWRLGKRINPCVIQKALYQISSALKYLHRHHIIYRDLKAENVLVLAFPGPNVADPSQHQVLLKLTDYGISRSASLGGIKGFMGTPGFMAPEILRYTGKESYTDKVDCFSFGSLIYELIALQHPYSDVANDKARLAQLYMQNGKRPRLTSREKRSSILLLSLLYRCWAQNPEDRPSAAEINTLVSLEEFPKLSDTIGLGEDFYLQCVATTNQSRIDCSVVDSRTVIGSHLWFCGYKGFGPSVSARKEGFISVFSYHDGRYTHANNLKVSERIVQICSVGSSVWIGTESGHIQVFCALTYKPVGFCFLGFRVILKILHSPVCNTVLVSVSDGSVYAFDDNISKYNNTIPQKDVVEIFHNVDRTTVIRKLVERTRFASDFKIHCMAGVTSRAVRRYSQEVIKFTDGQGDVAITKRDNTDSTVPTDSPTSEVVTYELWCGQDKGRITVLEMNTLKSMKVLPVNGNDLSDVFNEAFNVQFIETSRTYDSAVNNNKTACTPSTAPSKLNSCVWVVAYPGTKVARWNVDKRVLENSLDASQHSPWHDLNSGKPLKKSKTMRAPDAQIYSLAIVEGTMYVGTTSGCFLICDAFEMVPTLSVRCYEEFVDAIIPLRMITSRNPDECRKKLVLTCGRKCLDAGIRNIDRKKKIISKETTILVWTH